MTPEEYIKAYTRGCSNELVGGGYHEWLTPENALAAVELAREKMKAAIKCEKKSPITGGEMRLMQEKSSVKFRGEDVTYIKKYYHCVDSGQDFTDTELDNDNMWAIFRAYWERRGFEHFYDIDGLKNKDMTPKKIARDMLEAILYDNDMVNKEEPLDENKLNTWIVRVIKGLEKPIEELGLDFFTEEWIEEFCDGEIIDDEVKAHPCLGELNDVLNDFFDEY